MVVKMKSVLFVCTSCESEVSLQQQKHTGTHTCKHMCVFVNVHRHTPAYIWLYSEAARGPSLGFNYPSPQHTHTVPTGHSAGR